MYFIRELTYFNFNEQTVILIILLAFLWDVLIMYTIWTKVIGHLTNQIHVRLLNTPFQILFLINQHSSGKAYHYILEHGCGICLFSHKNISGRGTSVKWGCHQGLVQNTQVLPLHLHGPCILHRGIAMLELVLARSVSSSEEKQYCQSS